MDEEEKVKPEYEMYYGIPYRVYCGSCGRLVATMGKYWLIDDVKENNKRCRWCGKKVDWD